ncbi:Ku protein [Variovorax sp. KK3]|uniref:non-homologous end joining protein Ku n=1 Tax=Variovorax sp. KK3 TaxID=1855728 RepID=UPI00097C8535|nr:Ku protein [Variovorax sp. KK3]
MAARSIASLSLGFGLVSIPVKLYSATESASAVRFNLLSKDGSRLKQQYVSEKDQSVVPRAEMVKGYEFEKDRYVIFQPEELKALEEGGSHLIDIVSFIPEKAVDPIFFDKTYFLAPDKRGGKPYNLLKAAMQESGRCALARWAWKSKQYVVQVRATDDGLVLQQLLFSDEVRSQKDLDIEQLPPPSAAELKLALQLIEQISADEYDPTLFEDEEKKRILAAIDAKIAGEEVVAVEHPEDAPGAQVIDLTEMLRASLGRAAKPAAKPGAKQPAAAVESKGAKRAPRVAKAAEDAPPARARMKK